LREVDSLGVDVILARGVADSDDGGGLGPAIRDRLFRAAEGRVFDATPAALQILLRQIIAATPHDSMVEGDDERQSAHQFAISGISSSVSSTGS
jgi:hypothetical protein